jgi:hypothetical protein
VLAYNPPDQAAGGNEMALPLLSRMTHVRLHPRLDEIQTFFRTIGADGSTLRSLGLDWSATLEASADLVTIDPPPGALQGGAMWGNPRNWERGLRLFAGCLDAGLDESKESDARQIMALLAGSVGDHSAPAYLTIRKVRHQLPSIAEITSDPLKAKLPSDISTGIASIGLLEHVAQKAPNSAICYASRLENEIKVWATKAIVQRHTPNARQKFHPEALKARIVMLGQQGAMTV